MALPHPRDQLREEVVVGDVLDVDPAQQRGALVERVERRSGAASAATHRGARPRRQCAERSSTVPRCSSSDRLVRLTNEPDHEHRRPALREGDEPSAARPHPGAAGRAHREPGRALRLARRHARHRRLPRPHARAHGPRRARPRDQRPRRRRAPLPLQGAPRASPTRHGPPPRRSPSRPPSPPRLQTIDAYARAASAAGGFDDGNAHLTRTALRLDARGWNELSRACLRLLAQVDRIEEAAKDASSATPTPARPETPRS